MMNFEKFKYEIKKLSDKYKLNLVFIQNNGYERNVTLHNLIGENNIVSTSGITRYSHELIKRCTDWTPFLKQVEYEVKMIKEYLKVNE